MNTSTRSSHDYDRGLRWGRLGLMGFWSLVLVAALYKQLPVHAQDRSAAVSVADLDLATATGLEAARERLHQKARRLCERVVDPQALSHQPDYVRCVDDATAAAVTQLQGHLLVANARLHTPSSTH